MKRGRLYLLLGLIYMLFLFPVSVMAADTVDLPITVEEDYSKAQELLGLINEYRAGYGTAPMQMDDKLQEISMQRAAELAISFNHDRPDGSETINVLYPSIRGENIGSGAGTAQGMFDGWRSSPLHEGTMAGQRGKYCGIGCILYEGTRYWVLNTSETAMGSVTAKTGVQTKKHTVSADKSKIKFKINDWLANGTQRNPSLYYGQSAFVRVVIQNFNTDVGIGYVCTPEVITYRGNSQGVADVSPNGVVTPKCAGSASMTVALVGDPSVKTSIPFEIVSNTLYKKPTISIVGGTKFEYNGSPIAPKFMLTDCFGNPMTEGKDYYVEYANNNAPGRAYARIWMTGNYADPASAGFDFYTEYFTITEKAKVQNNTGSGTNTPSGNNTPSASGQSAQSGQSGQKSTSSASSTTAKPKKTSITSVKSKTKRKLTVKWKKVKGVSGYQVQYALNKKLTKSKKTKKISGAKKTTVTLSKLKSRKIYYIRIRTYKKVKGKTYYSSWSKAKRVRVK